MFKGGNQVEVINRRGIEGIQYGINRALAMGRGIFKTVNGLDQTKSVLQYANEIFDMKTSTCRIQTMLIVAI